MADSKAAPKGAAGAQSAQGEAANGADRGATGAEGRGEAKAPAAKITKMDAVKAALKKLGKDALPSDIRPFIQKTFGIEMTADHISTYKGDLARKARAAAEAAAQTASAKKPAAPKAPGESSGPADKPTTRAGGDAILLDDVLTTKDLMDRVGAENLRTLIDRLAK